MKNLRDLITLFTIAASCHLFASNLTNQTKYIESTPPRIIRTCCAFGSEIPVWGVPFLKITHITSIDQLGEHTFLGGKSEGNGLIYTRYGGFIDIGHLRDIADWTNYLYTLILENRGNDSIYHKLGYEGGPKLLRLDLTAQIDSNTCLQLAGKIAYDLSLWHELSTWFGASTVPMMPERYSSFSIEDAYSNLLGVYIAMEALQSGKPYNLAMTETLSKKLTELGAVATEEETFQALELVQDVWWTREKRLPNSNVILERNTDVATIVEPWLVPDLKYGKPAPKSLMVPRSTSDGNDLTSYYEFSIDLNHKFPVKELFPTRPSSKINQDDFAILLDRVSQDLSQPSHENLTHQEHREPRQSRRISKILNL